MAPRPRSFESLPFAERFTLWTMRFWTAAERGPAPLHPLLREGFAQFGVDDAYIELNRLLSIVTAYSRRPFAVLPRDYPSLSPDEMLFLGLVASTQHRLEHVAHATLYRRLTRAGADMAMPVLIRFATHLKAARIHLARPYPPGAA